MLGRCLLMLLLPLSAIAAPAADLWPYWEEDVPRSAARVDHSQWQRLLDRYLVSARDERTLFRYDAVTDADRNRLDAYLRDLAAIDPRTLQRAEQLPYWINLYNALTVRVVLDHPNKKSIRRMGEGFFSSGPWDDALLTIAGQPITLNDIEHRILRPIWKDHRIHYAVNCASVSCPNLAPQAYRRDNTARLLESGEQSYLHHPRGLELQEDTLYLSSIFKWYLADFGGTREALLSYLAEQRSDLSGRLRDFQGKIRYRYDWALNEASAAP